jgi:rhodanese-related sulfurtransferase
MRTTVLLAVVAASGPACDASEAAPTAAEPTATPGAEARRRVEGGALLVDVRTPQEFAAGHLPGAVNVPVDEVGQRIGELAPPGRELVVYCRSGGRSARAARTLEGAGYSVYDLGAMSSW